MARTPAFDRFLHEATFRLTNLGRQDRHDIRLVSDTEVDPILSSSRRGCRIAKSYSAESDISAQFSMLSFLRSGEVIPSFKERPDIHV